MSAALDLFVLGDVNPDVILTGVPDELAYAQVEQLVEGGSLTIGGSAAILACGAARLGLRVALAGVVGDDAAGRFMLTELAARGVDAGPCAAVAGAATGLTVNFVRGDDRAVLTFPGCIAALDAAAVEGALVRSARHLHASSFFLQPRLAPGLRPLFEEAHAAGASTSLDVNWDPAGVWDGGLREVLTATDVLLVNREEALALTDTADVEAAAEALADTGVLPVVKCGPGGALAIVEGAVLIASALPVQVADTIGAGDSFDAGFLAARLDGLDVQAALELACACGSLSARGVGGVASQPTMAEALGAFA